jgi:hypothetical protein
MTCREPAISDGNQFSQADKMAILFVVMLC